MGTMAVHAPRVALRRGSPMSDARSPSRAHRQVPCFWPCLVAALLVLSAPSARPRAAAAAARQRTSHDKAVFFASDGLRQDSSRSTPRRASCRRWRRSSRTAPTATGNGLLTQAPPNTGAGWYTPRDRRVAGRPRLDQQHVPHQRPAVRATATAAFDAGVLQAETIAQSAERGGLKVAQVEWAGGRERARSTARRSTSRRSSPAAAWRPTSSACRRPLFDDAAFIASFGLQFDHPAGFAGQAPVPAARPRRRPPAGPDVPPSYSPAKEMRLRVLDFGADKYGLNAYIFDSTNDGDDQLRPGPVLADARTAPTRVGTLRQGPVGRRQGQDRRRRRSTARPPGMLVKVEELTADLSRVRLFHTSVTRAIATWPTWPGEPGFTGDFAEYLAQTFPTSTAADFADPRGRRRQRGDLRPAGPVLGDRPHRRCSSTSSRRTSPTCCWSAIPTTDEFQHQFLGLVTPDAPERRSRTRPTTTSTSTASPDGRVAAARGVHPQRLPGRRRDADAGPHAHAASDPTTFVASDHGFAPQFLAIDASKVARRPRPAVEAADLELPPRHRRDDRQGQGLLGRRRASRSTSTSPAATRPDGGVPAGRRRRQEAATVAAIKAAFLGLTDPNDWTHDGQPEGWKVIDRAFTKAEARYIPNGPGSTADMAHPTRTGDLVVFAYPPYQFDAETPGHARSRRRSSSASTATCRTSRTSPPTSTCGRRSSPAARTSPRARSTAAHDRPRADARLHARHPRAAAQPGPGPARRRSRAATASSRSRSSGSTTSTASSSRPRSRVRRHRTSPVGGARAPGDDVRRGAGRPARARPAPRRGRQRRRLAAELGACSRTCRRSTSRTPGASTPRRTATTSSTTASTGSSSQQARAHFPFLATNIVDDGDRADAADWVDAVGGLHRQRHQGRRHRRRAAEHARARRPPATPPG